MLNKSDSMLLVIDIQEKLVNMLPDAGIASKNFIKIIKTAQILNIKTVLTEQYPQGLGRTIQGALDVLDDYKIFEKTSFSAAREPEILDEIKKSGKKQIVLFGIEAHICVYQTALELTEMGYEVFVVSNASYSRCDFEKETALQNLRHLNTGILTIEMLLFLWLENSKNPDFKVIQNLIK